MVDPFAWRCCQWQLHIFERDQKGNFCLSAPVWQRQRWADIENWLVPSLYAMVKRRICEDIKNVRFGCRITAGMCKMCFSEQLLSLAEDLWVLSRNPLHHSFVALESSYHHTSSPDSYWGPLHWGLWSLPWRRLHMTCWPAQHYHRHFYIMPQSQTSWSHSKTPSKTCFWTWQGPSRRLQSQPSQYSARLIGLHCHVRAQLEFDCDFFGIAFFPFRHQ